MHNGNTVGATAAIRHKKVRGLGLKDPRFSAVTHITSPVKRSPDMLAKPHANHSAAFTNDAQNLRGVLDVV